MPGLKSAQMMQPPPATGLGSIEGGQIRVRQHLNPLSHRWSQPVELPSNWYETAFQDTSLPLVVDLGVAKGRFLLKLAAKDKSRNYLGLEIREPLVHQANRCAVDAGLTNLFYIACNANVSLASVLDDCPEGVLRDVYVQFCDPWFKKRHAKRRMVNMPLVEDIHNAMRMSRKQAAGDWKGEQVVFMQSDVIEVAEEMRYIFDSHGGFKRIDDNETLPVNSGEWLVDNPLGLPTEREIAVLKKDGQVYRALYHLVDDKS